MDEFHIRSAAEYAHALSRFPYPVEIVHGRDALAAYERLKRKGAVSPVVLGGASEFTMVFETYERGLKGEPSVDHVLQRANEMTFPGGYRALKARELDALRAKYPDLFVHEEPGPDEFIGGWPDQIIDAGPGLAVATEVLSQEAWPRVHIATLPTDDATAIPAYLRAGGWNDCPPAEVMVSALRSWRDRYGAELLGFSHDTMNLRVARGPQSRPEAIELAGEHYLFCSDQLNEVTLVELAACLIEHDWWFFWWD